ncbi:MAG: 1-acyl-sn-glycerol-3-phosphate acyltransferase [Acidobacteria bacterium]|nr:1-acyl-sn-glycerol-3-phosphate acyltransferase [Acidobacteriota bacterium]
MNALVSVVATVSGWLNLALATLVCATGAILTSWVPPRGAGVTFFARLWSRWWLAASGVRVRRTPPPRLPGGIYLANHASWYDIPSLIVSIPGNIRFLAKRTLFQIPIFGWALRAGGFIPVDRQDKSRAKESFQAGIDELRRGGSLVLFPEGTRSRDGRVHTFQRGGFLLALKSGLPIVPVGVEGTYRVLPRTTLRVRPRPVTVHFGAAVDPADYGLRGRRRLISEVRAEVARLAGVEAVAEDPSAAAEAEPGTES